jgi:hypothetical protein
MKGQPKRYNNSVCMTEESGRKPNPYYVEPNEEDVEDDYSEDSDASCGGPLSFLQEQRRNY